MKLTADSNILLRAIVQDDVQQARLAQEAMADAELIAIPLTVFCEFAWVASRLYKYSASEIADAIGVLVHSANVVTHQPAVEAGLAMLEAGGDFADGVIAFEGKLLGADTLLTFDKQAARLIESQGGSAHLLTAAA